MTLYYKMAGYVRLFSLTLKYITKRQLLLKNEFSPQVLTWATCWWTSVHWPPFSLLPPTSSLSLPLTLYPHLSYQSMWISSSLLLFHIPLISPSPFLLSLPFCCRETRGWEVMMSPWRGSPGEEAARGRPQEFRSGATSLWLTSLMAARYTVYNTNHTMKPLSCCQI